MSDEYIEHWTGERLVQEIKRLRAENERLNYEAENWCPEARPYSCRVEIERLRAENAELRDELVGLIRAIEKGDIGYAKAKSIRSRAILAKTEKGEK